MLDSGGSHHAFAAHFLCLAYLPQQLPLLLQKLLIFLRHRVDPLLFLKAAKEETRGKKQNRDTLENIFLAQTSLVGYLEVKKGLILCHVCDLVREAGGQHQVVL